jgi:hypothetical protein
MSEIIIISNTCVGQQVHNIINNNEYNNPFVATLFVNDLDFIKLCNNIHHYISYEPVLGIPKSDTIFVKQNGSEWYKHDAISTPYPIIFLDDIEIHCIHEQNPQKCLETFTRRFERMKTIMAYPTNYKLIGILSFSELINDHNNTQQIIDVFLSNKNNIFIGPSIYKNNENINYIIKPDFDYVNLIRNSSHIYYFNDQDVITNIFTNHINTYYK